MFHLWEKLHHIPTQRLIKGIGLAAFIWLLTLLLGCATIYWGISNYAERGKAAAYKLIPSPPDSVVVSTKVFDDYSYYRNEVVLYTSNTSLIELRDWFHQYISMSPLDGEPTGQETSYSSLGTFGDPEDEYSLVMVSVSITGPDHPFYEFNPDCFDIFIATSDEFLQIRYFTDYFPTLDSDVLKGNSVIFVRRCWPHNE